MVYQDPQKGDDSSQLSSSRLVFIITYFSFTFPLSFLFYLLFTKLQQETDNSLEIIQLQPLMKNSPTELGKPPCYMHVMATEMTDAKLKPSHPLLSLRPCSSRYHFTVQKLCNVES